MRLAALLAAAGLAAGIAAAAPGPTGFTSSVAPVRWDDLRGSYRAGCPVPPRELRRVTLAFRDFAGRRRTGVLVVHRRAAPAVVSVFRTLYAAGFPIRRLQPVSAYGGSDDASMAADNTSGFNCRRAVGSATGSWSQHAYGLAIDVNPVENPYVLGNRVLPPAGARFLDRRDVRPGMAVAGGVLVRAFERAGWTWGGRWLSPDYQHFSASGR